MCIASETEALGVCTSDIAQSHHHFELVATIYPIQFHALLLGLFASLVAPFGGFLASAIKRAYGIKDFDSLIPGHGGMMDRMDCQFLSKFGEYALRVYCICFNTAHGQHNTTQPTCLFLNDILFPNDSLWHPDSYLSVALCTWVHYNTFVSMATVSVPKLIYLYNLLGDSQKAAFLDYARVQQGTTGSL